LNEILHHIRLSDKATGWTTEVRFLAGVGIYSPHHSGHTSSVGPTRPPFRWVPRFHSPRSKVVGMWSLPPKSSAKNAWSYVATPQYIFIAWCL